jgi:predicted nuclease of predicted toxin-antitoxin system
VRFLVDAQLPPALARKLSAHGHHAEHVTDIGPADASDRVLWQYALEHSAVLVTKDEDFPSMLALGGDIAGVPVRAEFDPERRYPQTPPKNCVSAASRRY